METVLSQTLKSQLILLQKLNISVIPDLCKLAWEVISRGTGSYVFNSVAQKIQFSRKEVEEVVDGISCLIFQIYSRELTEQQFLEIAEPLQLEPNILKIIYALYVKHEEDLKVLRGIGISTAQFSDLQWRLESELASRSRKSGLNPRVILKLDLNKGGAPESIALLSDIPNILRWSEMVEQALAESTTQNARRIHRAVQ